MHHERYNIRKCNSRAGYESVGWQQRKVSQYALLRACMPPVMAAAVGATAHAFLVCHNLLSLLPQHCHPTTDRCRAATSMPGAQVFSASISLAAELWSQLWNRPQQHAASV